MANLSLNLSESPMQLPLPDGTVQCNFAVNLVQLMEREEEPVPKVVKKCIEHIEDKGLKIVTDLKSFLYLVNTELEFSDGLNGKGFFFNNPNASRSCGCGESFAV